MRSALQNAATRIAFVGCQGGKRAAAGAVETDNRAALTPRDRAAPIGGHDLAVWVAMLYRTAMAAMVFSTMVTVIWPLHSHGRSGTRVTVRARPACEDRSTSAVFGDTSILTVSPDVAPLEVPQLVKLSVAEEIHAVDGERVADARDANRRLVTSAMRLAPYHPIEIAIDGPTWERRVFVMENADGRVSP